MPPLIKMLLGRSGGAMRADTSDKLFSSGCSCVPSGLFAILVCDDFVFLSGKGRDGINGKRLFPLNQKLL